MSGAKFLADRHHALLADDPRVGKTGAAIMAADYILAGKILVVTTASGRAVWKHAFPEWSSYNRPLRVLTKPPSFDDTLDGVTIVGWPSVATPKFQAVLARHDWHIVILDESHYAKNPEAKRTQAIYGEQGIARKAKRVWCLTGTPMPNAPNDLWPMLNALAPDLVRGDYASFMHRYCVVRMMKLPSGFRKIPVVIGGRNLPELHNTLRNFMLRRTQAEVGIVEPVYETFPLIVSDKVRREAEAGLDAKAILAAAAAGETKVLEMHLGPLRRITGEIKARAVVEALKEEFDCGLGKIVLMHWHTDVGRILREGLEKYGVASIGGFTDAVGRVIAENNFREHPKVKVFVGQIQAAGEAIDLSAADEMLFVETSFVPAQMKQASLRITNLTKTRNVRVRVAVLDGSIDEALQSILLRKWSVIREILAA